MVRIIFWTIVIILFLSFFGISIQALFAQPITQSNFNFIFQLLGEGLGFLLNGINAIATPIMNFINSIIYHKPIY
jgi:hypothetical protein